MAKVGLEPTRIATLDFESSASAIPPLGRAEGTIHLGRSVDKGGANLDGGSPVCRDFTSSAYSRPRSPTFACSGRRCPALSPDRPPSPALLFHRVWHLVRHGRAGVIGGVLSIRFVVEPEIRRVQGPITVPVTCTGFSLYFLSAFFFPPPECSQSKTDCESSQLEFGQGERQVGDRSDAVLCHVVTRPEGGVLRFRRVSKVSE